LGPGYTTAFVFIIAMNVVIIKLPLKILEQAFGGLSPSQTLRTPTPLKTVIFFVGMTRPFFVLHVPRRHTVNTALNTNITVSYE